MKQIIVQPEIHKFNNCKDFVSEFSLGKGDLIITSESCYKAYFEPLSIEADVIFPRNYGEGEPSDTMVEAMYQDVQNMKEHKRIIAIGGGTVLDIAKLFALKYMHPLKDLFDRKLELKKNKELIMLPTTCGTGSEVTNISIVSFIKSGTKMGLADPELFADHAVLIPELLEHLPYPFFATSSIDALIHAIESSLSPKATPFTKLFGYKAIEMILDGYKKIAKGEKNDFKSYLEDFLLASTYAGLAFGTAGCATVHAMSYPLSGTFHVAHGEANYVFLTAVLEHYFKRKVDGSLSELFTFMSHLLTCEIDQVTTQLTNLLESILPKHTLSFYGVTEDMLPDWSVSIIKNQQRLLSNSYVSMHLEEVLEIYKSLMKDSY